MKKELSLAVFLGLLIGLTVAGIFYHQRQQSIAIPLSPVSSDDNLTVNELDSPNPTDRSAVILNIVNPQPNSVVNTDIVNP